MHRLYLKNARNNTAVGESDRVDIYIPYNCPGSRVYLRFDIWRSQMVVPSGVPDREADLQF